MRVLIACIVVIGLAAPVAAQRRPIGAEDTEKIELPEGDQPGKVDEEKRRAEEEAKRKAEQEKAEAEKRKILEEEKRREAAEQAAKKAAEEKKRKEAEAAKKKAEAAAAKKKADAEQRQRAALKAARAERILVRTSGPIRARISLRPGAPEVKAVEEVRLDLAEKLKVPDPRFGEYKPLVGANLVATVTYQAAAEQQPKGKRKRRSKVAPEVPEPVRYRVHALEDAGVYGFHTTMLLAGKYTVQLEGTDADGRRIEASFDLYPGVWPPPDWEQERQRAATSTSRRRPILTD